MMSEFSNYYKVSSSKEYKQADSVFCVLLALFMLLFSMIIFETPPVRYHIKSLILQKKQMFRSKIEF